MVVFARASENIYSIFSAIARVDLLRLVIEVGVLDLADTFYFFFLSPSIGFCSLFVEVVPPLPLSDLLLGPSLPLVLVAWMRHAAFGVLLIRVTIEVLPHVWLEVHISLVVRLLAQGRVWVLPSWRAPRLPHGGVRVEDIDHRILDLDGRYGADDDITRLTRLLPLLFSIVFHLKMLLK